MAYVPPFGIPNPGFGIDEVPLALPSPWTSSTSGFYYVDNTSGSATDADARGWPAQPRLTIPTAALPADAVVVVHGGPYLYLQAADSTSVTAAGTAGHPVFLLGSGKPSIKGIATGGGTAFTVKGTYYIVDGFRFCDGTRMDVRSGGSYGTFRNNEFFNFPGGIPDSFGRTFGSALQSAYDTYPGGFLAGGGDHYVIYNNVFTQCGNYLQTPDCKVQGIKYGGQVGVPGTGYVWILDNLFFHNGQAMQHGDDAIGTFVGNEFHADTSAFPHHFYIGRNTMHDDREVAVALKMMRHVVVSQNVAYNYQDLPAGADCSTSPTITALNIGRFATDDCWVIFNTVYNSSLAIRSNGQTEAVQGPDPVFPKVYILGNLVYNIRGTTGAGGGPNCNPLNVADPNGSGAAIIGWDTNACYVYDNTILDCDKGISFNGQGYDEVQGNLIVRCGDPMSFIPINWGTNNYDYNFFEGIARLAYGGNGTPIISLATMQTHGQELHSMQGTSLVHTDGTLPAGSPPVGANTNPARAALYDLFFSLYGIDIKKDHAGRPRPAGAWTVGAFESGTPTPAPDVFVVITAG